MNGIKKLIRSKKFLFAGILIFLYNAIFNTFTANYLFSKFNSLAHNGNLTGEIVRFSLFYGIELDDLHLREKDSDQDFLSVQKLRIHYSLPSLFLGKIQIHEIGIYSPKIYLSRKNGTWNYQSIFPPGEKKDKVKKEESPKDPRTSISTFVPIQFFFLFKLENPEFLLIDEEEMKAGAKNFDLSLLVQSYRFREIPLNERIIELIKDFEFQISPERKIPLTFENKDMSIHHDLDFSLHVFKKEGDTLNIGSDIHLSLMNFQPILRNKTIQPIHFLFQNKFNYFPETDRLEISEFELSLFQKKWLQLNGFIEKLSSNSPLISLEFSKSRIELGELSRTLNQFPISNLPSFNGIISIDKFSVQGEKSNPKISLNLGLENFQLTSGKNKHSIPILNLESEIVLDLIKKNEAELPYVKSLILLISNFKYNDISLTSNINYKSEEKFNADLNLEKLNLSNYSPKTPGFVRGVLNLNGKNLRSINSDLDLSIQKFKFPAGEFSSKPNNLNLKGSFDINLLEKFKFHSIRILDSKLSMVNPNMGNAIDLNLSGDYLHGEKKLLLSKIDLSILMSRLLPLLPNQMAEKLSSVKKYLGDDLKTNGSLKMNLDSEKELTTEFLFVLPGINLNDLKFKTTTSLNIDGNGSIKIHNLSIDGYQSKFHLESKGFLKKKNGKMVPDISLKVDLTSTDKDEITKNLIFQGSVGLDIAISETRALGNFYSKDTNLMVNTGNCPGQDCKIFQIHSINMNVPIEHEFLTGYVPTILEGDKSRIIKPINKIQSNNFSILRIKGPHPFLKTGFFDFVQGQKEVPGITGRIEYINNLFSISALNIKILNGMILGKNILFNIKDANPENMEYMANLQIKNLDLTELLTDSAKKNIDDGKIMADMNISGRNLKEPIPNLNMYFSIYKIGKDFGKSAINVILPPNLLRDYIVSSYSVDKIETELTKGLVYANILFNQGLIPNIFTKIENNKISQERMPLANFLNRAKSEISTYR